MKCLSAAQMREWDRMSIEDLGIPGPVLMEVAGRAVAELAAAMMNPGDSFIVVAGPGNNGGDGYVAARHLLNRGFAGQVLLLGDPEKLRGDAAANRELFVKLGGDEQRDDEEQDALELLGGADLIIDAIFGTGLGRDVEGRRREMIEAINSWQLPVVAVDIPSGLDADSGQPRAAAVQATATATFGAAKLGMLDATGAQYCGELHVVDIGLPPDFLTSLGAICEVIDQDWARAHSQPVDAHDHKGNRGHLLLVAGSSARAGAAWLAARGALRAGLGLASLVTSPGARARMGSYLPELMVEIFARGKEDLASADVASIVDFCAAKNALLIGPGLALGAQSKAAIVDLLKNLKIPAVVDAEAINALAGEPEALTEISAPLVLTPHPGELARLLNMSIAEIQADRLAACTLAAEKTGHIVLLKGAHSVVASADGRRAIIPVASASLGTAGSGDVLGGIIGAILARGSEAFVAACLGAFVHASAGPLAAEREGGLAAMASDIADAAGVIMDLLRSDDEADDDATIAAG